MSRSVAMDARRRKLRFRAWRRGIRELDLIMGGFADARLADFDDDQLDAFEALLEYPDWEVYSWVCHGTQPPEVTLGPLLEMLRAHQP